MIIGIQKVDWQPKPCTTFRRDVPQGILEDDSQISFLSVLFGQLASLAPIRNLSQFYNMALPDGQDYRHVSFPKSWLEKVEPMQILPLISK